jgi:hypothetical protein
LHRCHWYANAGSPVHEPAFAASVCPWTAVPEIDGDEVFDGAASVTTPVWPETAVADPAVFVPVTATRIVEPTSAAASR